MPDVANTGFRLRGAPERRYTRRRPGTLAGVGLRQVAPVRGEFPSEVAAAVLALEDDAAQPV